MQDTAFEHGRLWGYAWAAKAPMTEVAAIRRGERRAIFLRDFVPRDAMAALDRFGDDRGQAELDAWEGFVAGVNELIEGSLDSQDLMRRLEQDEARED